MRIAKIALLALFVASTLIVSTGTSSAAVPCTPKGVFQDDNPNGYSPHVDFNYIYQGFTGPWTHSTTSFDEYGEAVYKTESYTPGNAHFWDRHEIEFTLNCVNGFDLYYAKAFNRGRMLVYTNGQYLRTIDQYTNSTDERWQQWTRINLPPGINHVVLKRDNGRNDDSQGWHVGFDGIIPR